MQHIKLNQIQGHRGCCLKVHLTTEDHLNMLTKYKQLHNWRSRWNILQHLACCFKSLYLLEFAAYFAKRSQSCSFYCWSCTPTYSKQEKTKMRATDGSSESWQTPQEARFQHKKLTDDNFTTEASDKLTASAQSQQTTCFKLGQQQQQQQVVDNCPKKSFPNRQQSLSLFLPS